MNYNEMTDDELNRLSAERFGFKYERANFTGYIFQNHNWDTEWKPTHPDSNQARQYLIPKMVEYDYLYIMASELLHDVNIEETGKYCVAGDVLEKSNRDIVIACLKTKDLMDAPLPEAWEKINE